MKMDKYIIGIIILLSTLIFASCSFIENNLHNALIDEDSQNMIVGDNLPVSRALASKMIALTFNDINTINNMDREITFVDTNEKYWFDKYINMVYIQGIMQGSDNEFRPNDPLTIYEAKNILDKIYPANNIVLNLSDDIRNMPISYALWVSFYKEVLDSISGDNKIEEYLGIKEENFVVLATHGNNSLLPEGHIITDKGHFTSNGISSTPYIDKRVNVLHRDGEIIAILGVLDTEPTIENVFIVSNNSNTVTIFSGGAERTYRYRNSSRDISSNIANVKISGDEILDIYIKENFIDGNIKRVGEDFIEIEDKGRVPAVENLTVFSLEGENVMWRNSKNLIVGSDTTKFIIEEDKIISAIITQRPFPYSLRVALNNTEFSSLIHEEIIITSDYDFIIQGYNEVREYNSGDIVQFRTHEDLFLNDRIYIKPLDEEGSIQISSIQRNWPDGQSPSYRGIIEIAREEEGFTIINEISMQEYLYAVIPSEMPSSFGVEASKVQAITARSFAYNQFFENRLYRYGANIDDSVMSQVYNNIPPNEVSIQAVDETKGMYLTFEGEVVSANYFSTSSGMTANWGEVWQNSNTGEFPTSSEEFLTATKQYTGDDFGDLTIEENAFEFFRETDIESFDNNFSWFRWTIEMQNDEISASINRNLENLYNENPSLIKTLQEDETFRSKPVDSIGELVNIEVLTRGEGGNIMEMKITGTENTIIVKTELNIRRLLAPYQYIEGRDPIVIERFDGTNVLNYTLMPSSFFVMERMIDGDGNILYIRFSGGGNGHGVGMSQNGAKGKILQGYNFIQVLEHFYEGAEVVQLY